MHPKLGCIDRSESTHTKQEIVHEIDEYLGATVG
jgi:hypothetical protein